MDHWDPALIGPLAAARPVLLIDGAGVGRSTGNVPLTFAEWAAHYVNVIRALNITQIDVLGFSMGGCVAQMAALNAPDLVRILILCGTIPSKGEGTVMAPLKAFNQLKEASNEEEQRAAYLATFFAPSERSQRAGRKSWDRITHSRPSRTPHVNHVQARRQGISFANFMDATQARDGSYNRLHELRIPVLVANGRLTLTRFPMPNKRELTGIPIRGR